MTPGLWINEIKEVGNIYFFRLLQIDEAQHLHQPQIPAQSMSMAQESTAGNLAFKPHLKAGQAARSDADYKYTGYIIKSPHFDAMLLARTSLAVIAIQGSTIYYTAGLHHGENKRVWETEKSGLTPEYNRLHFGSGWDIHLSAH